MERAGESEGSGLGAFADVGEGVGEKVKGARDGIGVSELGLGSNDVAVEVFVFRAQRSGVFEELEPSLWIAGPVVVGQRGDGVDGGAVGGFAGRVEPER